MDRHKMVRISLILAIILFILFPSLSSEEFIPTKTCFEVGEHLSSIKWDYSGDFVAIGGKDGVYLYDKEFLFLDFFTIPDEFYAIGLYWDLTTNYLAVLYGSSNIYIWDVEQKQIISSWRSSLYTPNDLTWIPDSSIIAVLTYDGVSFHDYVSLENSSNYSPESPLFVASNIESIDSQNSIIFQFISTDSAPVVIFDLENHVEITRIDEVVLYIFTWDMNNERIFWAGHNLSDRETPLQNEIYTTDKNGNNKEFFASFTPNSDNTLTSGRGFYSLSLNKASTYLATFGFDQWIYIWKIDDKTLITSFEGLFVEPPSYDSLAWSPDGQFLGSVGDNGQACIWDMSGLE